MKAAQLPDLVEALEPVLADAVDGSLRRVAADLLLEHAIAEAHLSDQLAPLALPGHERKVLSALLAGTSPDELGGLGEEHFYSRQRGLCFALLCEGHRRGRPLDRDQLASLLLRQRSFIRAKVELLLGELDRTEVVLGQPLADVVNELIAASAWNVFMRRVRTLNGMMRARAASFDDMRQLGALDATAIRAELHAAARDLTPALRACCKESESE